jgi:plasmid maintenance system antidote protein VapI
MTAMQFKLTLLRLGMDQHEAAAFLGISVRACHAYANGTQIPLQTAMLLRLMARFNVDAKTAMELEDDRTP